MTQNETTASVGEVDNTPEQIAHKREYLREQHRRLRDFIDNEGVMPYVQCYDHNRPRDVRLDEAYRCRQCDVWLCPDCALKHFGLKIGDGGSIESAAAAKQAEDRERLDFFDQHTECDLIFDFEETRWLVHKRSGNINDREWIIIGEGETPRDAIDAAIAALKGGDDG